LIQRLQIEAQGVVQGVGFRPFVYSLARRYLLSGFVLNGPKGVLIEVEGDERSLEDFAEKLLSEAPPLASIEKLSLRKLPTLGYESFSIRESVSAEERFTLISPDIATCQDCLAEIFDPGDRRYRYPFTNCTNCGPRFTIIKDIPYDRPKTTMGPFEMCPDCLREYGDPSDRRFHAQPNACPRCGPKLSLLDRNGLKLDVDDEVEAVRDLLVKGYIVAIKGLGGYHLACDALNELAVSNLRNRKYRQDKPFALMAPSLEVVERFCYVSEGERRLLCSPRRPIVLLRRRPERSVAPDVAPRQNYLGFMLPYTPLHHLVLEGFDNPLVMTSGNISDEPIAYKDGEALRKLSTIADFFLTHNREIYIRCDDSVTRVAVGREMIIRRSRGYVPQPIRLGRPFRRKVLACGAHLKNTFCLTRGNYAFLSHHIGDLENFETLRSFEEGIEHFKGLFQIEPELVAYDLHPDYLATSYALSLEDIPKIGVQHHHAHIASCLAENGVSERAIGVSFDGTGYGTDGRIWGGEFLMADLSGFERAGHLRYMPMPGGDMAVREPWRMAASYLYSMYGEDLWKLGIDFVRELDAGRWEVLAGAMDGGMEFPLTSSVGRLFDAVSALLGIRGEINYEAQAAIELEMAADGSCDESYGGGFISDDVPFEVDSEGIFGRVVEDVSKGVPVPVISAKFHNTLAEVIAAACEILRGAYGVDIVALSGGVFQNILLLERTVELLSGRGFRVCTHSKVPPNDGGISLGQAVVADASFDREGSVWPAITDQP